MKRKLIVFSLFLADILAKLALARPGNGHFSSSSSGGSSSSGSGGWSHSSSSWGSSGGYSHHGGTVILGGGSFGFIILVIVVFVIYYYVKKNNNGSGEKFNINDLFKPLDTDGGYDNGYRKGNVQDYDYKSPQEIEAELNKITEADPEFFKDGFVSRVNELFMFIYGAWEKRDLTKLRAYETDSLFNLHRGMLQEYIDKKQINMLDNICIRSIKIIDVSVTPSYHSIKVLINATLNDYIIDEDTGKVVYGSKSQMSTFKEKWTLTRKASTKTKAERKLASCPNCGAPLEINSEGECEYCRTVITTGGYDWVLSNIEQVD